MCSNSVVFPYTFCILPSLDHFLPTLFHLHLSHNLLLLHPAWILPFALQSCRQFLSCCTLQLIKKLLPCLFLCKSNTSPCISSCLFILIPMLTCCFDFMPYLIASSFLLNSFSYLIIPPPCFTMPRWSFCPPTYLFCCLLPYLFHCIPFAFYTVSFKSFVSVTNRANSCYRQDTAKQQTAGIKFTHRPKIRFFIQQGRLVAQIHIKLGRADGHVGPLACGKFHLNSHRGVGMRPKKYQKFPLFGKRATPLSEFENF